MVAALLPILSDARPKLARRAGFGDRFHYWRGASGRRYLFSRVPADSLADFTGAVVILAGQGSDGRLAAREIFTTTGEEDRPALPSVAVLVHLLAHTDGERKEIVVDLTAAGTGQALRRAAAPSLSRSASQPRTGSWTPSVSRCLAVLTT